MFHEEKLINGILHFRSHPQGLWTQYTIQELSAKYLGVKDERDVIAGELDTLQYNAAYR